MARVIVAGCGFVGLATARFFHNAGWEVLGIAHSAESAARLNTEPFRIAVADISHADSLRALREEQSDLLIHCASSNLGGAEAYRAVYRDGCANLLSCLTPRRLIFTSSTSVYAQVDGTVVTEESAAEPTRETGHILRDTEELVIAADGIVARLAGIYGPGRSVLLRKFFSGEAVIEGDGSRVINQVHRDDIATALLTLAERGSPGLYNVVDDSPKPQLELYRWLADHFARPLPPTGAINPNRKRGWTSKRVSNQKLRGLGWSPNYPSFFDAVACSPELVSLAIEQAHQVPDEA